MRPFQPDEDYLFFGREREIVDLLRRLRKRRFISIVGSSGSGKSSLVRSGLVPALQNGSMAGAGSSWRIAIFHPADEPITALAAALNQQEVLGVTGELADTNQILIEATLFRGPMGLVEAVRQAQLPPGQNLLIVVDQFEELFRYRHAFKQNRSRDMSMAFVKLLLQAAAQTDLAIYIAITMRSDFIGDCMDYPGLPEAINAGQYLVPRLARDELRLAITGPITVGGATIAQRLTLRLLNEFSEAQDELPILQHALMRTWDHWALSAPPDSPLDIEHYETIGTMRRALSLHAEEAYAENGTEKKQELTAIVFKALVDTFSDARGVRRPTSAGDLAAIHGASVEEVAEVLQPFRRHDRSFITPSAAVFLQSSSVIDLSHEALLRNWERLAGWAEKERLSATTYVRLAQASRWHQEGVGGLWHNPELGIASQWQRENAPTEAWALRYDEDFDQAIKFLKESEAEEAREREERVRGRRQKLRRARVATGVLALLLLVASGLAHFAFRERDRAEGNLQLAKSAVDESLSAVGDVAAREAADVPEMEAFRRQLLQKAKLYYLNLIRQDTHSEALRRESAAAHLKLGDIQRLLEDYPAATQEYRGAISAFEKLAKDYPKQQRYEQSLGYAHNWLGETMRLQIERQTDRSDSARDAALKEYQSAVDIQQRLADSDPSNADLQQQFARTIYNRGILLYDFGNSAGAESEFRAAVALLGPLADKPSISVPPPAQELARTANNLANLLVQSEQPDKAEPLYKKAVAIDEKLLEQQPVNREYMFELATFSNNLAILQADGGQTAQARENNARAAKLLETLSTPAHMIAAQEQKVEELRKFLSQPVAAVNPQDLPHVNSLASRQRSDFAMKLGCKPDPQHSCALQISIQRVSRQLKSLQTPGLSLSRKAR